MKQRSSTGRRMVKLLPKFLRDNFLVEPDPSDPDYARRYAADVIDGFRVLSFIVCATMTVLSLAQVLAPENAATRPDASLSLLTSSLLAVAGAAAYRASKSIRSPAVAFLAAAALLGSSLAAITIEQLVHAVNSNQPPPSIIPVMFLLLMLGTALIPLRPGRVLGLGLMLLLACAVSAAFLRFPLQGDLMDFTVAAVSIAVSGAISARSTHQRIRTHHAHLAAVDSARQTEQARVRAVLAESAVTMERLAASLSHELNTPIGALNGATETLMLAIGRHATFPKDSPVPQMVQDLTGAIRQSAARLKETVTRIQRFANLDRSAIRLTDVNQLVQDAVALMNPPSANQALIQLNLTPLAQIWCRPHSLSVSLASILNIVLQEGRAVSIDTDAVGTDIVVRLVVTGDGGADAPDFEFGVVDGHVRATGWDLFAARQLLRETGGDLRTERAGNGERKIHIAVPATFDAAVHSAAAEGEATSAA